MRLTRLIILLIPFNVLANDVISEHNEAHSGLNKAQQALFDQGCVRTEISRSGRYQLIQYEGEYIVIGNQLRIVCVEFKQVDKPVEITWSAPTAREDGSMLFASDIEGYKIYINGQYIRQTAELNETVQLMPGSHEVNVTTIDKTGQESVFSKTAIVGVK